MLQTLPPVTHQEIGGAVREDEVIPVPHNRDDVDESESIINTHATTTLLGNKASSVHIHSCCCFIPKLTLQYAEIMQIYFLLFFHANVGLPKMFEVLPLCLVQSTVICCQ